MADTQAMDYLDYLSEMGPTNPIAREYDKSKKVIKVELSDITMPIQKGVYPSNDKTATVKCIIKYRID